MIGVVRFESKQGEVVAGVEECRLFAYARTPEKAKRNFGNFFGQRGKNEMRIQVQLGIGA